MQKTRIKNRKGQKVVVVVEKARGQKGLAIIMHGLGGFKEQPHIQSFASAFKKSGYTVVTFDTTNSIGESDGEYEKATITNYYQDLEDVIAWAKKQPWYKEPFILSGHSLGGFATALYAENHPSEIFAIAPISPMISGKLSVEAHMLYEPKEFTNWKKTGWLIKESASKPGVMKKLPWSHMEDRSKYDLLQKIERLKMPVLLIVGENDISTPPQHVEILYKRLPGAKELHIIKGAPHTFRDKRHLDEIRRIFLKWIRELR